MVNSLAFRIEFHGIPPAHDPLDVFQCVQKIDCFFDFYIVGKFTVGAADLQFGKSGVEFNGSGAVQKLVRRRKSPRFCFQVIRYTKYLDARNMRYEGQCSPHVVLSIPDIASQGKIYCDIL